MSTNTTIAALLLTALAAGCSDDPQYVPANTNVEFDPASHVATDPDPQASVTLPIKIETAADAAARAALAAQFGVSVPYVRVGDLGVELSWSVKNLSTTDGTARIFVNGGNETFTYVPAKFVADPGEDPTPPPLMGNVPIPVAAGAVVTGLFSEDDVLEASIDLELITRGAESPFRALLTVYKDIQSYQPLTPIDPLNPDAPQMPMGPPIPRAAMGQLDRFDVALSADQDMVVEFALRIRDHRGIIADELNDTPAGQLTVFSPVVYVPPPPVPTP